MSKNPNIIKEISLGRVRTVGIMLTTPTPHLKGGHKYNTLIDLTPAGGMRPKRRCGERTRLITKPWVAVAPTCKTAKGNQFAQGDIRRSRFVRVDCDVTHCTPSETVARNLASKGKARSVAFAASCNDSLDTACGYGACEPHNSATKTWYKREGLRLPAPFFYFSNHKGAKAMKHINDYIEAHAWTWYAFAAVWAFVIGSCI